MKIRMTFEFDKSILSAVADHLGKKKGTQRDVRDLIDAVVSAWADDLGYLGRHDVVDLIVPPTEEAGLR